MSFINRAKQIFSVWLRRNLPAWFFNRVRFNRRKKRLAQIRSTLSEFNRDAFVEILNSLGVNASGSLFVHSGADWLSKVDGGPFSILKDLMAYMEGGTLVMPSFPIEGMASDYIDRNVFSVNKSPSRMGLLTELFRRSPGVQRSLHPTHSVCALGEKAGFLLSEHECCLHPFDASSPFGKLVGLKGQILLVGVGLDVLTHIHTVEDVMGENFPYKVYEANPRRVPVINSTGDEVAVTTYVHNPAVSVRKNIPRFEADMIADRVMHVADIGGVVFRLLDAEKLENFLREKAFAGVTVYD